MRASRFLLVCLLLFAVLCAAYAILVDKVVIPVREVPEYFTQFMLESSAGVKAKVVVDSGSNSHYAFDVATWNDHWHAPMIIVADHGSYPLRNKIFNLGKYLNPGDVLILPLEWPYYVASEDAASVFLSRLTDADVTLDYYFNNLPLFEKLRFIFSQLPFSYVISAVLRPRGDYEFLFNQMNTLVSFEQRIGKRDNASFGGSLQETSDQIEPVAASMRCDQYVHSIDVTSGKGVLSTTFLADLELLHILKDSGVQVYFTWPTVVDRAVSACYRDAQTRERILKLAEEIVTTVKSSGFQFVGEIEQAHFGPECFLDTYYHLRHSCAVQRTTRLVAEFEQAGIQPINSAHSPQDLLDSALDHASKLRRNVLEKRLSGLPTLNPGRIDRSQLNKKVSAIDGWYKGEAFGIWSRGPESIIELKVDPDLLGDEAITLQLEARYFRDGSVTTVNINGLDYGEFVSPGSSYKIPTASIKGQRVTITLRHRDVASPAELGVGKDKRSIYFVLQGLTIE